MKKAVISVLMFAALAFSVNAMAQDGSKKENCKAKTECKKECKEEKKKECEKKSTKETKCCDKQKK